MMIGLRSDPEATLFLRCSVLRFGGACYGSHAPGHEDVYAIPPIVYRWNAYVISTER